MNNKKSIIDELRVFNLSEDEARLYVALIEKPNTHLAVARKTGINRSKVYRIAESLLEKGLIARRVDDRGAFLIANDPGELEITLVAQEAQLSKQRAVLDSLVAELRSIGDVSATERFAVQTYEGVDGFKQMQWHELSSETDVLVFGNMTIEQLGISHHWAEKMRTRTAQQGYRTREIYNQPYEKAEFTVNNEFLKHYEARLVSPERLPMRTPMVIYNNTVSIYQFDDERRVGAEIINAAYAQTMRSIFEQYWQLGTPIESGVKNS